MSKLNKKGLIILSGGGTSGSVSPLLAVAESLYDRYNFLFIGTRIGPERRMAVDAKLPFIWISSGKFRRYFSLMNLVDIFFIVIAFFQSFVLLIWKRPILIMTAGSFASVPLVWVASILRIPVHVHQQDLRPGLSNKLMAPFAKYITVSFESSLRDFKKGVWTGNPVRIHPSSLPSLKGETKRGSNQFIFNNSKPILLFLGGGTGAEIFNLFVEKYQDQLLKFCNIIISTGKGKMSRLKSREGMVVSEFFDKKDMASAYACADLVLSRAGLGNLTELASLAKPTLICPMHGTHQEANAGYFAGDDDIVVAEKDLNTFLLQRIETLVHDKKELEKMSTHLHMKIKENAVENVIKTLGL